MGRKWTEADLRAAWSGFYVEREGCHEWSRARNADGYGYQRWGMKQLRAHRLAYELFVGPIPDGMVVMHDCDNPCCVNPAHLTVGTQQENLRDMHVKDRGAGHPRSFPGPDWPIFLRRLNQLGLTQSRLGEKFGAHRTTVSAAIKRAHRKDSQVS